MKTFFVSGHLDLTQDEFDTHYAPKIREYAGEGHNFVVGDAPGCDEMTQRLLGEILGSRYRVFHMLESPRRNLNGTRSLVGGYRTDEERDAAMTRESHEDIAWVRPGKRRNNGTGKNLQRRVDLKRHARQVEIASWPLRSFGESEIYPHRWTSEPDENKLAVLEPDETGPTTLHDHAHVPSELVERMKKAWIEYSQCQHELEVILREQGKIR